MCRLANNAPAGGAWWPNSAKTVQAFLTNNSSTLCKLAWLSFKYSAGNCTLKMIGKGIAYWQMFQQLMAEAYAMSQILWRGEGEGGA